MDKSIDAVAIYQSALKHFVSCQTYQASGYTVARRRVRRYDRQQESRIVSVVPFKIEYLSPRRLVCVFRQDSGLSTSARNSKAVDSQLLIERGQHDSAVRDFNYVKIGGYSASMIKRLKVMLFGSKSTSEYSNYHPVDLVEEVDFLGEDCYHLALSHSAQEHHLWISKSRNVIVRIVQTDIDPCLDRMILSDLHRKIGEFLMIFLFWIFIAHDCFCVLFKRYDLVLITDSFPYVEVEHVFTDVQINPSN